MSLKEKINERLESARSLLIKHKGRNDWYGCIHWEAKISELEWVLELMNEQERNSERNEKGNS